MEIGSYRMRTKKIALPQDGMVPSIPYGIAQEEQDGLRDWIARLSRSAEFVNIMSQRRADSGSIPTRAEISLAWKKWILSHHLFVPMLSLTGQALSSAAESMRTGKREASRRAVEAAARMRRGCGALFMYSVDFQPCAEIYCTQIRNQMPPAFSGYEIRERQNGYQPAVALFNSEFSKNDPDSFVKEMRSMWVAAELRYHELHERCMFQAVASNANEANGKPLSKPESLRAAHRRQYGEVPAISEETYQAYDRWFAIERRSDVSWFDYVYELCDVIERLLADLLVGHRLEPEVVTELVGSTQAVLDVFVGQVNASTETFTVCPQQLHGSDFAELYDAGSHS